MYAKRKNDENRLQNMSIKVPLADPTVYNRFISDGDLVIDTIAKVTWDLINFPIQMQRAYVTGDADSKGTYTIGYVDSYDSETNMFTLVIFGRYVDIVAEFENPLVLPRVFLSEGYCVIQNLLLGQEEDFEYLTHPQQSKFNRRNWNNQN